MTTAIEFRVGNAVGTADVYHERDDFESGYLCYRGQIEFYNIVISNKTIGLTYNSVLEAAMMEGYIDELQWR
jgi:hypothetical protein|tara:strand:+ start:281 stop:496 length:216 start_codon:yes stop_codon:yes gene_type:complete